MADVNLVEEVAEVRGRLEERARVDVAQRQLRTPRQPLHLPEDLNLNFLAMKFTTQHVFLLVMRKNSCSKLHCQKVSILFFLLCKTAGFRVQGTAPAANTPSAPPPARVQGSGCRVQGAGFRAEGAGFRVQGTGPDASTR